MIRCNQSRATSPCPLFHSWISYLWKSGSIGVPTRTPRLTRNPGVLFLFLIFNFVFHHAKQLEAASSTLLTTHSQTIISSSLLFYKIRHDTGVLIIVLSSLANSIMRWVIATLCRNWIEFGFKWNVLGTCWANFSSCEIQKPLPRPI